MKNNTIEKANLELETNTYENLHFEINFGRILWGKECQSWKVPIPCKSLKIDNEMKPCF